MRLPRDAPLYSSPLSRCLRLAHGLHRAGFAAPAVDPDDIGYNRTASALLPSVLAALGAGPVQARGMQARIDRVVTPVATLEQVLEFYARNGDVPAGGNLGNGIGNVRLNPQERAQIVEFLKALTDDRVKFERAPFDHPSLCVPVGYQATADAELFALV